jgi:hypothetical protein
MTTNEENKPELVTRSEAAVYAGVTLRTVDRWTVQKLVKKYINPRGQVRLDLREIKRLCQF